MSQLSFDFNAAAPPASPVVEEVPTPAPTPDPEKKFRASRLVRHDWTRLFWLTRWLDPSIRPSALTVLQWARAVESQARYQSVSDLKRNLLDAETNEPAFFQTMERFRIPIEYPMAFLDGLGDEIAGTRYQTLDNLLAYAYRASGSVALMLAHVVGLSHPGALKNACDLGMAAHLTLIARSVREDFEIDRVFLPLAWLEEEGVAPEDLFVPRSRAGVWRVVVRLITAADRLYSSADIGLRFLPFRAALAVAAGRRLYAQSGRRLISIGSATLDCPVVASPFRERASAWTGALPVLRQIPSRLRTPWKPASLHLRWDPFNSTSCQV